MKQTLQHAFPFKSGLARRTASKSILGDRKGITTQNCPRKQNERWRSLRSSISAKRTL